MTIAVIVYDVNMNWFFGNAQIESSLLRAISCRIGEIGGISHISETAIIFIAQLRRFLREIDMRYESAVLIGFALVLVGLLDIPFLVFVIPLAFGFTHHAYMSARNWLPEQIV